MVAEKQIVVAGGSGLLGSAFIDECERRGDSVVQLVRSSAESSDTQTAWDPSSGKLPPESLNGAKAAVCLSGENIAARWTEKKKRRIRDSRINTAGLIAETVANIEQPPDVLVCASAVGYYGDRGDEVLTESSPAGAGFLADVCKDWEDALEPARQAGIRTVSLRFGVILSRQGGFLPRILPIFKLGLGGRIGSGAQYMSWISLHDAVRALIFAIDTPELKGAANAVAPEPVTNAEFTAALAHAVRRPALFPVPEFALKLLMGKMGEELALASARAIPEKLTENGFSFEHGTIGTGLETVLGSKGGDTD